MLNSYGSDSPNDAEFCLKQKLRYTHKCRKTSAKKHPRHAETVTATTSHAHTSGPDANTKATKYYDSQKPNYQTQKITQACGTCMVTDRETCTNKQNSCTGGSSSAKPRTAGNAIHFGNNLTTADDSTVYEDTPFEFKAPLDSNINSNASHALPQSNSTILVNSYDKTYINCANVPTKTISENSTSESPPSKCTCTDITKNYLGSDHNTNNFDSNEAFDSDWTNVATTTQIKPTTQCAADTPFKNRQVPNIRHEENPRNLADQIPTHYDYEIVEQDSQKRDLLELSEEESLNPGKLNDVHLKYSREQESVSTVENHPINCDEGTAFLSPEPANSNFYLMQQGHEREKDLADNDLWPIQNSSVSEIDLLNVESGYQSQENPNSFHQHLDTQCNNLEYSDCTTKPIPDNQNQETIHQPLNFNIASLPVSNRRRVSHHKSSSVPCTRHKNILNSKEAQSVNFLSDSPNLTCCENFPSYTSSSGNMQSNLDRFSKNSQFLPADRNLNKYIVVDGNSIYSESLPQPVGSNIESLDQILPSSPQKDCILTSKDSCGSASLKQVGFRERSDSIKSDYSNDHYLLEPLETVSRTMIKIPVAAPISNSYFRSLKVRTSSVSLNDDRFLRKRAESVGSANSYGGYCSRTDLSTSPSVSSPTGSPITDDFTRHRRGYLRKVYSIDEGIDLSSDGFTQLRRKLRSTRSSISIPYRDDDFGSTKKAYSSAYPYFSSNLAPKQHRSISSLGDFARERSLSSSSSLHKNILFFEKLQEEAALTSQSAYPKPSGYIYSSPPPLSEADLNNILKKRHHLAMTNKLNHSEAASILGVKLSVNNEEDEIDDLRSLVSSSKSDKQSQPTNSAIHKHESENSDEEIDKSDACLLEDESAFECENNDKTLKFEIPYPQLFGEPLAV